MTTRKAKKPEIDPVTLQKLREEFNAWRFNRGSVVNLETALEKLFEPEFSRTKEVHRLVLNWLNGTATRSMHDHKTIRFLLVKLADEIEKITYKKTNEKK